MNAGWLTDVLLGVLDIQTPSGYSPGMNVNETSQSSGRSTQFIVRRIHSGDALGILQMADLLSSPMMETTRLTMLAEPCYSSKLRYRSDYGSHTTRQGYLKNRNPPLHFQGPAIRVCSSIRSLPIEVNASLFSFLRVT